MGRSSAYSHRVTGGQAADSGPCRLKPEDSSRRVVSSIAIIMASSSYQRLVRGAVAAEDTMTFGLSPPSCDEEAAYVDMNCSPPQGHPRTLTIESGISEISLLPPDSEEALPLHVDDESMMELGEEEMTRGTRLSTRGVDIPGSPLQASAGESASSLPNGFLCAEDLQTSHRNGRSIPDFKKPQDPDLPSSPFSTVSSMRNSASSGCLESKSPEQQSPTSSTVSISFPRILRNSFSKLLTRATSISSRSKSPESAKSSLADEDNENFVMDEDKKWCESDENLEEIVSDSVQKGLPIIPFSYPTFSVVNKKLEETKDMIRKNSAKDLKRAFNENRANKLDIYNEEEEEGKEDKSLNSVVNTAIREIESSSSSSYVEMSLNDGIPNRTPMNSWMPKSLSPEGRSMDEAYMSMGLGKLPPSRSLNDDPYMRMSEDPYMRMREQPVTPNKKKSEEPYMPMNTLHTLPKKSRRRQSEQEAMFQLDSDLPNSNAAGGKVVHSPDHHPSTSSYSERTFPRRKRRINIFNRTSEDGDRNNQILNGSLVRPFRKGNKHKDDYVFVDFEKQNYMNMASSGSNKWKFLNFSSGSSK